MNAAEVIECDVERHGSLQVFQLFTESICQARKATKMHPNTQIGAFDVRGRNAAPVRMSNFDVWDCSDNLTAAIPPIGIDATIDFVKLPKIDVLSEVFTHRAHVAVVLIGRDLIAASRAFPKIADEGVSVDTIAGTDVMADEQFRFGVDCQPDHRAAPFIGIAFVQVRFPRVNEAPHLVQLHKSRRDVLDFGVQYLAAFLCRRQHQRKNRLLVQARKAGDGANTHPFEHQRNRLREQFRVRRMRGAHVCGSVGIGERDTAGSAAVSLNFSLAVGSEFLTGLVLASDAGHGLFSACAEREKPYNEIGSGVRLTPRSGLAPQPVSAGSGALIVSYDLRWWFDRDFYGVTGSECDLDADYHAGFILPESPVPAGLSHLTAKSIFCALVLSRHFFGYIRLSNPLVGVLAVSELHYINFATCVQPFQDSVQSGQKIRFVFGNIETKGVKTLSHLYRRERFMGGLEHEAHRIIETFLTRQWQRLTGKQFFRQLLVTQPRQPLDALNDFYDVAINLSNLLTERVSLHLKLAQLGFSELQRAFVVFVRHNRSIPCVQEMSR